MRVLSGRTLRTHCKHGHEFTPENTYTVDGRSGRLCRACTAARKGARKRTARAETASRPTFEQRFWAKVEKADGCWNWTGAVNQTGYGVVRVDRAQVPHGTSAIRKAPWVSYELHFGPVPEGRPLLHSCANRRCVKPDHLSVGPVMDEAPKAGSY